MNGAWIIGKVRPQEDAQRLPPATLLHSFLKEVQEKEQSCTEVYRITEGYVYSSDSLSAEAILSPVWQMDTDVGILTLNCVTGKIEKY